MTCRRCAATNGKSHSFEKIGILKDTKTAVYYTSPKLALEPEDSPEAVEDYLLHFNTTRPNPWIWIFDCKGMKSKDLIVSGVGKRLAEALQTNYIDTLKGVYVINPTWAMKAFLNFIMKFLHPNTRALVHVCSLGPLDILQRLQSIGLEDNQNLIRFLQS